MSKHILAFSVLFLSLALFYNGYQIGRNPIVEGEKINVPSELEDKGLLTMTETAEYLSITEKQLEALIKTQQIERSNLSSFDTYRFIPYIEINKQKLFNKEQVDEWIKYNSLAWDKTY